MQEHAFRYVTLGEIYPNRYKKSKARPMSSSFPWKYKHNLLPPSSCGKKRQGIFSICFFLGGEIIPCFLPVGTLLPVELLGLNSFAPFNFSGVDKET